MTDEVGLDFVHDAGPLEGNYRMPEIMGSGCALFDFDGDGLLDVYLLNNGGPTGRPNKLYKQLPDGTFKDVSKGSGLDFSGSCMGVAIGDVNNDGLPDVLVTECGRARLFLNNGDGTFTDVSKQAGIDNPGWGTSAAFLDYDRDGWLDLVVVNYVDYDPAWRCTSPGGAPDYCAPKVFAGTVTRLFRNLGGRGLAPKQARFEDVTASSGLARAPGPGLGVVCADFTGDGWPDVFVANDGKPNHLWVNQKNGTFKEEGVVRGVAYNAMGQAEAGMGAAFGDVNGDGLPDLFVTHLTGETHTLWRQGPPGLFRDRTGAAGLATPRWRGTGFGVVLADFDNNGGLDVAIANGRVARGPATAPHLGPHLSPYGERNQVFANDGAGHFRDVSPANDALCGTANVARGLARGDFNGNGGVDLLLTTVAGRARLLRNVAPERGHWLSVRALTAKGGRDSHGAEVLARAGARSWRRLVCPNDSYLCSSDARAHFGLGTVERVDHVEVTWPDGKRERFSGGAVDRQLTLRQGKGGPIPAEQ